MSRNKSKPRPIKKLFWWLGAQSLKGFCTVIKVCPARFLPGLGNVLGNLAYLILRGRRDIGLRNIRLALGTALSEPERKALLQSNFRGFTRNFLETIHISDSPWTFVQKNISVQGIENLESALSKGKGVIAVSAHLGNFPLIGPKMASLGYPFWLIARDPNNIYLVDAYKKVRAGAGIKYIPYKPRRVCVSASLKVLRDNGILLVLLDQNASRSSGIFSELFGHPVPTHSGPVVLAQRTGAAIVPVFIRRNGDGSQTIAIEPEMELTGSTDRDRDIAVNVQKINELYEHWIRQYPEQWWWIHRRFRRVKEAGVSG